MVGMTPEPTPALDTLDDIINALGGEASVAAACACGLSAISNWKQRGIPQSRWVDLLRQAQRLGERLSLDDLERADAKIRREASAAGAA